MGVPTLERFVDDHTPTGSPEIRVHGNGSVSFNTSFMREFSTGNFPFANLFYGSDEGYHFVGFSFSHQKEKGARKVYMPKKDFGTIAALKFFQQRGLKLNEIKGTYSPQEYRDERHGRLFLIKIPK